MTLVALTNQAEIASAYAQLSLHFDVECDILERTVGYQGGGEPATVRWFPSLNFWARLHPQNQGDGYWCGFGIENPHKITNLTLTCEINPPYAGIDRQRAGLFARSDNGTTYLAHNGSIGGGKRGVSRIPFLNYYGRDTVDNVHWPDNQITEYIIIAALDDSDLLQQVAAFVHVVAEFKMQPKG